MSLTACISRWPTTTRWPALSYSLAPAKSSSTDGPASFACRKSGAASSSSMRIIHDRVPTLPTPTTLRAMSTSRYRSSRTRRSGSRLSAYARISSRSPSSAAEAARRAGSGNPTAGEDRLAQAAAVLRECADPGPVVRDWFARELRARRESRGDVPSGLERLTERELAVLSLLPAPLSQRELAQSLYVSQNTMKTHVRAIYRKLGVDSRDEAVLRARSLGLL